MKSTHTMTLYSRGTPIRSYRVALGRGSSDAKQRQNDHQTPEGFYRIDARNAQSKFYLSLHVSYPNQQDLARSKQAGVPPGGDIMIHGVHAGFGWLGKLQHEVDWTDGCIAVSDREMDQVWKMVPVGTVVEIRH